MNMQFSQSSITGQTPVYIKNQPRVFSIYISYDSEAEVWCATSNDIPGLNIEGATKKEACKEASLLAPELLVDNHVVPPHVNVKLYFIER